MVNKRTARLDGRNGEIWQMYCSGRNQEYIADHFNLSQSRVSEIIAEVTAALPDNERDAWRHRALETLLDAHALIKAQLDAPLPPVFHAGEIVKDENGEIVRDPSPRLSAVAALTRLQERAARTLGTDAPMVLENRGDLRVTIVGVDTEDLK